MQGAKKLAALALIAVTCVLLLNAPASSWAAEEGDPAWTIYFRPAVRFGTDDRTLYIMDFFVPLYQGDKNVLFFNPKFTPNDVDGWETNLGIGYRHLLFNDKLILGANAYYDTRRTGWGTYWDQIGVGAEVLAELNKYVSLTGRFNYYIPLTDPKVSGGLWGGEYLFKDQGIYTEVGTRTVEEAPEGFNAELGFRVPFASDYVETWVYGGGYRYRGKEVGLIEGWSARLEVIPTDFIRLNYEYREDRTNKGEHIGEVAFEAPFSIENLFAGKNPFEGLGSRIGGSRDFEERLVEPVRRDVDIRVEKDQTDPGGERVEDVVFVSEDAENTSGTRDGTFEHPYASVDEAMADPGSGLQRGVRVLHYMNDDPGGGTAGGGTLNLAAMMIWGSGMPHPTYGCITNQCLGNPTIDSTLTLGGDDAEVFGADFLGTTGITVNGTGADIHDNYFINNSNTGAFVAGGDADIHANCFSGGSLGIGVDGGGSATITANFIGGGAPGLSPLTYGGILLNNGTIDSIADNTIGVAGGSYGIRSLRPIDSITGNTITVDSAGGGEGIRFIGVPSINGTVISTNTISLDNSVSGDAWGIGFAGCGDITYTEIASNTITVEGEGASTGGIAAVDGGGDYYLDISGNSITVPDANLDAWGIVLDADGSITADIHDNPLIRVTDAGGDASGIALTAGSDTTANIYDNSTVTVTGAGGDAIGIDLVAVSGGVYTNSTFSFDGIDTDIDVSAARDACGVRLWADGDIPWARISSGDISVYSAAGSAAGISLTADENIGIADISVNRMGVTTDAPAGLGCGAYGVGIFANDESGSGGGDVYFASVAGGELSVTSTHGFAAGVFEWVRGDLMGRVYEVDMNISGRWDNTYLGVDAFPVGVLLTAYGDVGLSSEFLIRRTETVVTNSTEEAWGYVINPFTGESVINPSTGLPETATSGDVYAEIWQNELYAEGRWDGMHGTGYGVIGMIIRADGWIGQNPSGSPPSYRATVAHENLGGLMSNVPCLLFSFESGMAGTGPPGNFMASLWSNFIFPGPVGYANPLGLLYSTGVDTNFPDSAWWFNGGHAGSGSDYIMQ